MMPDFSLGEEKEKHRSKERESIGRGNYSDSGTFRGANTSERKTSCEVVLFSQEVFLRTPCDTARYRYGLSL
ncbi:MAG: hypothetical protein D3916_11720 [Candidatus Electrothrix sp. MAN1_4]|nr:hypothetical protein [Candidatus Electrothrix sp. MAN1_4]